MLPLFSDTKEPHSKLAPHGLKDATTDAAVIEAWWDDTPTANVGIATGSRSGLVVVDLDPGADADRLDLPATRRVKTPRGGFHLYYAHPGEQVRNSAGKLAEHVDVRGDGGYVVAPPSVVGGKPYKLAGGKKSLTAFPPELLRALTSSKNGSRPAAESGPVLPGGRHKALVSMAGRLRAMGLDGDAIEAVLQPFNDRACVPPKDRAEVRRIAHDAAGRWAPDEADREALVEQEVRKQEVREEARQRVASKRAGELFRFPEPGRTLADDLDHPPVEQKYTVAELHTAGGNTLLVAQFKAGKTTVAINLIESLADGKPFLGAYHVQDLSGKVAWWNYELSPDMAREWMRDIGVEHPERVAEPLHLRGVHLPIWRDDVKRKTIEWLKANEIEFWILDPAARAWRGLVDNENDNSQLAAFTDALDEIKREAGVRDLLLLTHMGRATVEEDAERSRGGTRLEDWMDHGWYLTKDGKEADAPRALRAMGRDVDVPAVDLSYDDLTRRLRSTGKSRSERRTDDMAHRAVEELLKLGDGKPTSKLKDKIGGHKDGRQDRAINAAVDAGFIERRYRDDTPVDDDEPKPGVPMYCYVTAAGREAMAPRVKVSDAT